MTLVEADDEGRQTPMGLARYAYEYIEAAILVDNQMGAKPGHEFVPPIPAYFLALHGIELTLKAFMRHKGMSARQLRSKDFGHDVRRCYRKAKELGLREIIRLDSGDLRAMLMLLDLNEYQALRYIRTGAKTFPSWAIVEPFAVRLHQAVANDIGARTFTRTYG